MIPKHLFIFIASLVLFACLSCEREERFVPLERVEVKQVFEPVITDMDDSSPIRLPDKTYLETSLINSTQELIDKLPFSIIDDPTMYKDIDFNSSSLLSLKFRSFYKPYKIDYKIEKNSNGQIEVHQRLYTKEPMHIDGYYVMSNLIIDKTITYDTICLTQAYSFEYESTE